MNYGISYMGSKSNIIASIALNFPKAENFYDLFGGGFSVSHYMIKNKSYNVHYNEIEPSTVELVKKAIAGDFNYNKFKCPWVSREEFFLRKDSCAFTRILWSFGNNQKGYLFSKELEPYKESMHSAIVFDNFNDLSESVLGFKRWPENVSTTYLRRIYLRQKIEFYRKTEIPKILHQFLNKKQLEQLEQLEQLRRLQQLQQLEALERLQQLEGLQMLDGLHLERLEQLHFYSADYREIPILPKSVVYCDIPYNGAAEYTGQFSHKDFFDWAATRDFPVYISEYDIEDTRFELVFQVDKQSKLSHLGSTKLLEAKEKLYWNRKL